MSIIRYLLSPRSDPKIHGALTLIWLGLAVPAVLWWHNSVTFIVFASVYANVAGHWSAYQAARGEEDLKKEVRSR